MKTGKKISKNVEKVFFYVKNAHKPYTVTGHPLGIVPHPPPSLPLSWWGLLPQIYATVGVGGGTVAQIWADPAPIDFWWFWSLLITFPWPDRPRTSGICSPMWAKKTLKYGPHRPPVPRVRAPWTSNLGARIRAPKWCHFLQKYTFWRKLLYRWHVDLSHKVYIFNKIFR